MLLRTPSSWSPLVSALVATLTLAGLDLAGAVAAKEAVDRRSWLAAGVGAVVFVALFWVYASSLQYAELAVVTLGWVVLLQVGVVLLDRFRYDVVVTRPQLAAIIALLALEAYLVLSADATLH